MRLTVVPESVDIRDVPPTALEELRAWLKQEGFVLAEESGEMFFGDRRLRWWRHDLRLQLALDRGRWFVDVAPSWFEEWIGYGLEIVMDTLDESVQFTHLLTLRESVDILKGRLPEIVELLSTQEGCDAVEERNSERAHRWFGK